MDSGEGSMGLKLRSYLVVVAARTFNTFPTQQLELEDCEADHGNVTLGIQAHDIGSFGTLP